MKKPRSLGKRFLAVGAIVFLLLVVVLPASAAPQKKTDTTPESRALDMTAQALGWPERTNGGASISHTTTSGDITIRSMFKWEYYPASYYYYAGNLHGISMGETEGYQWGSGCSIAGGCNPPTSIEYFQFNFDMNYDGDSNIDTPSGHYLGYFCEVTVTAPEGQLYSPTGEAARICQGILQNAIKVRDSMQIPACVGVVCPQSMCSGNTLLTGGYCQEDSGECRFTSSQDCGSLGCNPGTGSCNQPSTTTDLCEGVSCEPVVCIDNDSYSSPQCDPTDGACAYYQYEDCGTDGCNPDTGKCNSSTTPNVCGSSVALGLVGLFLLLKRWRG